jgi:hypothetical protein
MTTRKILDRGNGDGAHGFRGGAVRLRVLLALSAIAAAATALVACSSSGTTSGASSGGRSTGTSTPATLDEDEMRQLNRLATGERIGPDPDTYNAF